VGSEESLELGRTLRRLPLVARVVISAFLIAVGVGYFSALVQLHVQQASPGQILPGPEEVTDNYHGKPALGQFERLIVTDETKPFTGSGSMRSAFTFRSSGWVRLIRERAKEKEVTPIYAENELRKERAFEINALVAWLHAGATEAGYAEFPLPADFFQSLPKGAEPDSTFFEKKDGAWVAKVSAIIDTRCVRCHATGKTGSAGQIHLDGYKNVMDYVPPDPDATPGGMSLTKLAQTTHAHLLSFAMLYALTGLVFAFTSYPIRVRMLFAPLALIAQLAEIACWWLSRVDPLFAYGIVFLGALVAVCLAVHIVLSLFDMYDKKGKFVVGGLLALGLLAFIILQVLVFGPHLAAQRSAAGM